MKKILALVLALAMLLSVTAAMADGIKVGIINLDPAESGYREANVLTTKLRLKRSTLLFRKKFPTS